MSIFKSKSVRLILVAAIVLLLPGFFGCYSAMTSNTSNEASPTIEIKSTVVNLGYLKRSGPVSVGFQIRNTGQEPLVLNRTTGKNENEILDGADSLVVEPNMTKHLLLRLQPKKSGNFQLDISYESNDPKMPVVELTVQGSRNRSRSGLQVRPERLSGIPVSHRN